MQQFYGLIICSGSKWLRLLELYVGDAERWPAFMHKFRRRIAQVSCEINRRHVARLSRWNFWIARIVDNRLSMQDRIRTAEAALAAKQRGCCMEAGFALRLFALWFTQSIYSIFEATAQIVMLAIFWSVDLTTALAECQHARDHNFLHKLNGWSFFAANSVTACSKAMLSPNTKRNEKTDDLTITEAGATHNQSKA